MLPSSNNEFSRHELFHLKTIDKNRYCKSSDDCWGLHVWEVPKLRLQLESLFTKCSGVLFDATHLAMCDHGMFAFLSTDYSWLFTSGQAYLNDPAGSFRSSFKYVFSCSAGPEGTKPPASDPHHMPRKVPSLHP